MPIILTESIERPLTMPSQNLNKKMNKSFLQTENKDLRDNLKEKMRRYSQELRKKSKGNNSYKPPLKINNFFTDINEEDSKYYQLNYPEIKSYQNKYEINKFEKRKKYIVPKITKSGVEESLENSKENDNDERTKLINQLMFNSEINFVQDFQKKSQEDSNKELKNIKERIEVLQKNNIDINYLLENEEEENEEEENKKEEKKNEENKKDIDNKDFENEIINTDENVEIENLISDTNENDNTLKKSNNNINKINLKTNQKRKPNVNSLEFYQKVREYMNNKEKNNFENNKENSMENSYIRDNDLNNNNCLETQEKNIKNKTKKFITENEKDNNYKQDLKSRNKKRTKKELKDYMRMQEEKRKENEIKKREEEKNKDLNNFKKLANLQKSINNQNKLNTRKKSKKVINGYYVGSNRKKNYSRGSSKSTILDKNEYFKNIIESMDIITSENKQRDHKNEMTKENYDKFIDEQENKIKSGQLEEILNVNNNEKNKSKNKKKNNNNNTRNSKKIDFKNLNKSENSFGNEMQKAENVMRISNDLMKQNNLTKYLDSQKNNNKENINNNTDKINHENKYNLEKPKSKSQEKTRKNNLINDKKNKGEKTSNSKEKKNKKTKSEKKEIKEKEQKDEKKKTKIPEKKKEENRIKNKKEKKENYPVKINDNYHTEIPIKKKEIIDKEKKEIPKEEEILNNTSDYQFTQEELELYNQILNGISDFLKFIIRRNVLNDIITYGISRFNYIIGLQRLVLICKAYAFNQLKNYDNNLIYYLGFRQMFLPYIARAFYKLRLYTYLSERISFLNIILKKIYGKKFFTILNNQKKEIFEEKNKKNINKNKKQNGKNNILNSKNKKEIERKLIKGLSAFLNPIRSYCLQKIYDYAYQYSSIDNNQEKNNISEYSDNSEYTPKNHTYIYESFSEKNSIILYPNSVDSDRLHRVYKLLEAQREKSDSQISENSFNLSSENKSMEEYRKNNFNNLLAKENNFPINYNHEDIKSELLKNISPIHKKEEKKIKDNNSDSGKSNNYKTPSDQKSKSDNLIPENENKNQSKLRTLIDFNDPNNKKDIQDDSIKKINKNERDFPNKKNNEKEKFRRKIDQKNILNKNDNSNDKINNQENKSRNFLEEISDDEKKNMKNINKNNPLDLSDSFKFRDKNINKNNRYKNIDDDEEEDDEIISIKEEKISPPLILPEMTNKEKNNLVDTLTEEIINNVIKKEITDSKVNIFPKKNPNYSQFNSNVNSQNYTGNNSLYSNQSELNTSYFMRPITEIAKDKTLNLYNDKIGPKLIKRISNEIDLNYNSIINNLKQPFKIDETDLMNRIMLKDEKIISDPDSIYINKDNMNKTFLNKEQILKEFEPINREIREENDNEINVSYDNILNECVIDATNDLLEKERIYGKIGEPIKWSLRDKKVLYKYNNDDISKKNLKKNISKQLKQLLNYKMALIAENYENIDPDLITSDRDKKFYKSITEELKEDDENWKFYENEETQIKLILSKIIMDQLLNEVVEILEHVQYSRKDPDKYQGKSIYACEDIPRLSFQNTTDNNDDFNDNINQ